MLRRVNSPRQPRPSATFQATASAASTPAGATGSRRASKVKRGIQKTGDTSPQSAKSRGRYSRKMAP